MEDFLIKGNHIRRVEKGWGYELIIRNTELYCGKVLHFEPTKQCSWHYHKLKDETFYVMHGAFLIYFGWTDMIDDADRKIIVKGDAFHVPVGLRHRMYNIDRQKASELFEFSTQHFDEDSIRISPGD